LKVDPALLPEDAQFKGHEASSQKFGVNSMMQIYKPFVFNTRVQRFWRFTPNF
jgi:hypothetical protein